MNSANVPYLWEWPLLAGILGAVVGSFLNVCIYRIPVGLSIVSPGSRCPKCETAIKWYQNHEEDRQAHARMIVEQLGVNSSTA